MNRGRQDGLIVQQSNVLLDLEGRGCSPKFEKALCLNISFSARRLNWGKRHLAQMPMASMDDEPSVN